MNFHLGEVVIRDADQNDIDTLKTFEQGVIEVERPFSPTLKAETTYYDLPAMMDDNGVKLLVAEWDNKIIGSGYGRIETSMHYLTHSHHAYLGFMYVLPEFRGKGVNGKLIESLKQWAQSKGIMEMRLEVYSDNLPAIRAYEKFGFSKLSIEMRCSI